MAEISVQHSNRIGWFRDVYEHGRKFGPQAADTLGAQLDGLAGFDGANVRKMLEAMLAKFEQETREMTAAEKKYASERADDPAVRVARDEKVSVSRQALMSARTNAENVLGPNGPVEYTMPATTPSQPDKVADALELVIHRLETKPQRQAGAFGNVFDTEEMRKAFVPVYEDLRAALDGVSVEAHETEQAMLERDERVASWERTYRGVANYLTGLFVMIGRQDLADRVRPTIRKALGAEEPPVDADTDVDEPVEA